MVCQQADWLAELMAGMLAANLVVKWGCPMADYLAFQQVVCSADLKAVTLVSHWVGSSDVRKVGWRACQKAVLMACW